MWTSHACIGTPATTSAISLPQGFTVYLLGRALSNTQPTTSLVNSVAGCDDILTAT